jgi:hypothetical protein
MGRDSAQPVLIVDIVGSGRCAFREMILRFDSILSRSRRGKPSGVFAMKLRSRKTAKGILWVILNGICSCANATRCFHFGDCEKQIMPGGEVDGHPGIWTAKSNSCVNLRDIWTSRNSQIQLDPESQISARFHQPSKISKRICL